MKSIYIKIALFLILLLGSRAYSKSGFLSQIPNGSKNGCLTCHTSSDGGARNKFGLAIASGFLSGNTVNWAAQLASMDSDGDGFSNGIELQDPNCMWKKGNPAPGNLSLVTNPGDANSKPSASSVFEANNTPDNFTIANFSIAPNPVILNSTFSYQLIISGNVKFEIYSLEGALLNMYELGRKEAGSYTFSWDIKTQNGERLSSGTYLCYLWLDNNAKINKIYIFN